MSTTQQTISTIKGALGTSARLISNPTAPDHIKQIGVILETVLSALEGIATAQGQTYRAIEDLKRPRHNDLRSI